MTLQDILVFATGASEPPPLGFDSKPHLDFTAGKYPTANTCGVTLYVPLLYSKYDSSPSFGQA